MPSLSVAAVKAAQSDDELHALLAAELTRLLGAGSASNHETFLAQLQRLPVGLRAMASVYQLEVSLALDDLGQHFRNWHDLRLAEEAVRGLKELGAKEHAATFAAAMHIAKRNWDFFARPTFPQEYFGSAVEAELSPLNERLWALQGYRDAPGRSIVAFWASYARQHPELVVGDA
jgi:hypothetical protein